MAYKNLAIIKIIKNTQELNQALSYLFVKKYGLKNLSKEDLIKILNLSLDKIIKCLMNGEAENIKIEKKLLNTILKNIELHKRVDKETLEKISNLIDCLEKSVLFDLLNKVRIYKEIEELFDKKELKNVLIEYYNCKYKINEKNVKKLFDIFLKNIHLQDKKNKQFDSKEIEEIEKIYLYVEENCKKSNNSFQEKSQNNQVQ